MSESAKVQTVENTAKGYTDESTISEIFFKSNGRLNRLRYFKRTFFLWFLLKMLLYLGYRVFGYEFGQADFYATFYNTAVTLVFVIPNYCLSVRRLQDMNRGKTLAVVCAILSAIMAFLDFTGVNYMFYLLLALVTVRIAIGGYMLIVPGTYGKNRYGASPI